MSKWKPQRHGWAILVDNAEFGRYYLESNSIDSDRQTFIVVLACRKDAVEYRNGFLRDMAKSDCGRIRSAKIVKVPMPEVRA